MNDESTKKQQVESLCPVLVDHSYVLDGSTRKKKETDRQTDRQPDRQPASQPDRQTENKCPANSPNPSIAINQTGADVSSQSTMQPFKTTCKREETFVRQRGGNIMGFPAHRLRQN